MTETYDIVIIGGGAAGFTAGIYAARERCRALGRLALTHLDATL